VAGDDADAAATAELDGVMGCCAAHFVFFCARGIGGRDDTGDESGDINSDESEDDDKG